MRRIGAILLIFLLCLPLGACRDDADCLTVYFFDVGQGDAALIRAPDGDILIDTGTEDSQELLCLRLEQLGVTEIKLMILSHNDEDHIGGADGVVSRFSVREVWTNGAPMESESAKRFLTAANQKEIPIRTVSAMNSTRVGDAIITVLSPLRIADVEAGNADSLVLTVFFGEVGMLFAGDVDAAGEAELLGYYGAGIFDCDVYKVSHHGASDASGEALLSAISPRYAVISCGAGNPYGHPSGETLVRLEAAGARILRTDLLGEILFECDGQRLRCLTDGK